MRKKAYKDRNDGILEEWKDGTTEARKHEKILGGEAGWKRKK
jgi:hypothetical protein